MKRENERLVALLGAVLCACACLTGCERKESSPSAPAAPAATSVVSRVQDAVYQAELKKIITDGRLPLVAREKIQARMEQLRARAKAALPAGATAEQVLAELENNAQKYPAWRELVAALKATEADEQRNASAAQSKIRQRILREVAEGRAQGAAAAGK